MVHFVNRTNVHFLSLLEKPATEHLEGAVNLENRNSAWKLGYG
jgi:hypothetical protein